MIETIGRLLGTGELTLRDGIAAEMRSIRRPFAEAEKLLREQVRIDPGFMPFARWCEAATAMSRSRAPFPRSGAAAPIVTPKSAAPTRPAPSRWR